MKYQRKMYIVEATKTTTKTTVSTPEGPQLAMPGDWIVTHRPGLVSVLNETQFAAQYEPVKTEAK
jgi:hypothetical protein